MIVVTLALVIVVLVVALVVQDVRHRQTDVALLDRVLLAAGQQPITLEAVETSVPKAVVPKRTLIFPVR